MPVFFGQDSTHLSFLLVPAVFGLNFLFESFRGFFAREFIFLIFVCVFASFSRMPFTVCISICTRLQYTPPHPVP